MTLETIVEDKIFENIEKKKGERWEEGMADEETQWGKLRQQLRMWIVPTF